MYASLHACCLKGSRKFAATVPVGSAYGQDCAYNVHDRRLICQQSERILPADGAGV
jgi:hypothetical protein